jgi:hypothetical protein
MTFDTQSASTTILPPRRPTTLPSTTPASVREVANRTGGSANEIVQQAIAQSGGAVIPLHNFSQGTATPPVLDGGSQTGTIAVVDDPVEEEVSAQGRVIPFADMARRRLMGSPSVPTNAVEAGPEDMMPLVADGPIGATEAPAAKSSPWPWVIAGGALLAMLWKFSQDSALHGAPLVADLEGVDDGDEQEADEPEGSEE